jgi:hypothetical protein
MSDPDTRCRPARAWLSAARDGEAGADPSAGAHLASCAGCGRWQAALDAAETAVARAQAAQPVPDVTAAALDAWAEQERRAGAARSAAADPGRPGSAAGRAARWLLVAAGVAGLVLAAVQLTASPGSPAGGHYGQDLLGFQVAFAVGFLLCARHPERYARALLPITAAAGLVVLLPSAADLTGGPLDLLAEAGHLPVLAGLAGLVLLVGATPAPSRRADGDGGLPTMAP